MGHDELKRYVNRPVTHITPERLRRGLIEHGICHPPSCHPACSVEDWFDAWPDDCLEAALAFAKG